MMGWHLSGRPPQQSPIRNARTPRFDQEAEHIKACRLTEGRKGITRVILFHNIKNY
jgi:hypothetical protein